MTAEQIKRKITDTKDYCRLSPIASVWADAQLKEYEEEIRTDERKEVLDEVEQLYRDWLYSEYGKKAGTDNLTIRVIRHLKERK